MLTTLGSATLKLHSSLFGYLPKLPVQWNSDETELVVSKSYLRWAVFLIFHIDAFFIMTINIYIAISHFLCERRPFFEMTHAFIFVAGAFMVIAELLIVLMLLYKLKDFLKGFNHIVALECQMMKAIKPRAFNEAGQFTNEGLSNPGWRAIYLMIFSFGTTPYWVIPAAIFMGWDPTFFLLREILPTAEYWGWLEIMGSVGLRFILSAACVVEVFRTIGFLLLHGYVVSTAILNIMKFLKNDMKSVEEFIHYYNLYTLSFRVLEVIIGDLLFVIITFSYWGICLAIWFCVVGFDLISPVMYVCLAVWVGIAVVITAAMMVILKLSLKMCEGAIRDNVITTKVNFSAVRTREAKWIMKRVTCLAMMKFRLGPFFKLRTQFGMVYFSSLIGRVIEMVIMFDLKSLV